MIKSSLSLSLYKIKSPVSFRALLISDLHGCDYELVLERAAPLSPDFILFAGDLDDFEGGDPLYNRDILNELIHSADRALGAFCGRRKRVGSIDYAINFLRSASSVAPVFYSTGNHDYYIPDKLEKLISREKNITLLQNNDISFAGLRIGGLTEKADLEWLIAYSQKPGYKILISHRPERRELLRPLDFDLVVSGHAHGGQWRIGNQGCFAPGQGFFPKYTSGIHGNMIVSRGIANTAHLPRFNNPPELVLIEAYNK